MADADALFRNESDRLRRYLFRMVGDMDVADDIVNETFLRAVRRIDSGEDTPRAWLYAVASNLARDRARGRQRRQRLAVHIPPPRSISAELRSHRSDLRRRLTAALAELSDRERTAILMREEGFAHREIATALDTTTQTIGTLLARTLRKLAASPHLEGLVGEVDT